MAKKTTETKVEEIFHCNGCDEDRKKSEFYKSFGSTVSGILPLCKKCCINKSLDRVDKTKINIQNFQSMLAQVDRPFIYSLFTSNISKHKTAESTIGYYFKDLGMVQNRKLRYKDSIFMDNSVPNTSIPNNQLIRDENERNRLIDKWGFGYTDEEIYQFEKKYDLLKENYPQKTAMHTEALLTYIRYRVKEETATARGDVAEAQKWGGLADKASERAKINPSQLSKADLTGGLNGFGELARAVERAKDIIEILPKFKEKPQDKVDFTLWCYINYVRRMKNLPDAEYKEIYKFYEERKEEYKRTSDREFEFEDE